jgi:hypothetical protein
MSFFDDLARLLKGGPSATAVATTSNTTTVTVNPNIINAIDLTPLQAPVQALVNSLSGVAPAVASIGGAIREAADRQQENTDELRTVATWVSVAGIAFALTRMVAGK